MRRRRCFETLTVALLTLLMIGHGSAFAQGNSNKPPKDDGGGGGGGGGSTLPDVRYSINLLPEFPTASAVPEGMNNSGMAVGFNMISNDDGSLTYYPFIYMPDEAPGSGELYFGDDLDLLAILYGWELPANFRIRTAKDVNEFGLVVGSMGTDDRTQNQGFAIDTDMSSDPAHWTFSALPTLGSSISAAFKVNDEGDAVARYDLPDGSIDWYLYNCYEPAANEPLSLNMPGASPRGINNHRQVLFGAGDMPVLFEEGKSLQLFNDADYVRSAHANGNQLNDNGIFSWRVSVPTKGRKTEALPVRRGIDPAAAIEFLMNSAATPQEINEQSDVLIQGNNLFHNEVGLVNVDDLILDSDPLKAFWVGNGGWSRLLTDRSSDPDDADYLRFPRIFGTVRTSDGEWYVVLLTPGPVPQ